MLKNRFGVPEDNCLYDAPPLWLLKMALWLFGIGLLISIVLWEIKYVL